MFHAIALALRLVSCIDDTPESEAKFETAPVTCHLAAAAYMRFTGQAHDAEGWTADDYIALALENAPPCDEDESLRRGFSVHALQWLCDDENRTEPVYCQRDGRFIRVFCMD